MQNHTRTDFGRHVTCDGHAELSVFCEWKRFNRAKILLTTNERSCLEILGFYFYYYYRRAMGMAMANNPNSMFKVYILLLLLFCPVTVVGALQFARLACDARWHVPNIRRTEASNKWCRIKSHYCVHHASTHTPTRRSTTKFDFGSDRNEQNFQVCFFSSFAITSVFVFSYRFLFRWLCNVQCTCFGRT